MEPVSRMENKDFEHMEQPFIPGTRNRVVVRISKMGGGTLGRRYDGRWLYRVSPVNNPRKVLMEGDDLNTGTPKTHQDVVQILLDFIDT